MEVKKKKLKMCEATSLTDLDKPKVDSTQNLKHRSSNHDAIPPPKQNQVGTVMLFGVPIVSLVMDGKERLCLAQISSTLLKEFSYNEIHNRRVALGITCIQCTPVQLEILRRAGAMPVTSRRCGMITRREAERLCQSFLGDHAPPQLPENFAFDVYHECAWGCRGAFVPSRYNSSRAKCIRCSFCQLFFSPNKFIFHSHRLPDSRYVQPDAANFNSWRRHLKLCGDPPDEVSTSSPPCPTISSQDNRSKLLTTMATAQIVHAWEDVKAMFNGGTRKRLLAAHSTPLVRQQQQHHQRALSSNVHPKNNVAPSQHSSSSSSSSSNNNTPSSRAVSPPGKQGSMYTNNGCEIPAIVASSPSFMNASTPLLSPTGRMEAIWNPGISSAAAAAAAAVAARQCQLNPSVSASSPALPPLPFHPLSIPWLRRPLFPFSHPFGPTCGKLFGENGNGMIPPDGFLASSLAGRQSQAQGQGVSSAFKPVIGSRGSEQLLSWFNNNAIHANNPLHPTLPEDLSLGSHCPELHHEGSQLQAVHNKNNPVVYNSPHLHPLNHATDSMKEMLSSQFNTDQSSVHSQDSNKKQFSEDSNRTCNRNGSNCDSDDEENVDIESTEVDRECFSPNNGYTPIWINSHLSSSNGRKSKRPITDEGEVIVDDGQQQQNRQGKKKRLWDCDKRMIKSSHYSAKGAKHEVSSPCSSRSNTATPELLPLTGKEGQSIVAK